MNIQERLYTCARCAAGVPECPDGRTDERTDRPVGRPELSAYNFRNFCAHI